MGAMVRVSAQPSLEESSLTEAVIAASEALLPVESTMEMLTASALASKPVLASASRMVRMLPQPSSAAISRLPSSEEFNSTDLTMLLVSSPLSSASPRPQPLQPLRRPETVPASEAPFPELPASELPASELPAPEAPGSSPVPTLRLILSQRWALDDIVLAVRSHFYIYAFNMIGVFMIILTVVT